MPREVTPWAVASSKKAIKNSELGGSVDTCIGGTRQAAGKLAAVAKATRRTNGRDSCDRFRVQRVCSQQHRGRNGSGSSEDDNTHTLSEVCMLSFIGTVIVGLIVGLIARALKPGDDRMGLLMTIILGIAGSLIAGYVGRALGWYQPGQAAGWIASVIGAIVLLVIYGMVRRRT